MRKVIIFVHEETNKVVSKLCNGCNTVKLSEDFERVRTTLDYSSHCVDCREEKKGA